MLRHVQNLGNALLKAVTSVEWKFNRQTAQPLLLSARDDADGGHYAVGYRLDGSPAFVTRVGLRCHAIVQHPGKPLALFVARRPGTESYLIDLRDGRLLQTLKSNADRHFYGHGVFHKDGEWLYATENDTRDPGADGSGSTVSTANDWFIPASFRPTGLARMRCHGCLTGKPWSSPMAASAPRPKAGSR